MLDKKQLQELLLQSLEHERGGVTVYQTALESASCEDLKKEWTKYLSQTRKHVQILEGVLQKFEIDPEQETAGREVVRSLGEALVRAMKKAQGAGDPAAAQLVACECVVIAETKDHADWELIGKCAESLDGDAAAAMMAAYEKIEDEEDEHLYHSKGWCRELWLKSLGLKAVLPPPEEQRDVKSAVEAAQAKEDMEPARKH